MEFFSIIDKQYMALQAPGALVGVFHPIPTADYKVCLEGSEGLPFVRGENFQTSVDLLARAKNKITCWLFYLFQPVSNNQRKFILFAGYLILNRLTMRQIFQ